MSPANAIEFRDFLERFMLKLIVDVTVDPLESVIDELKSWRTSGAFSRALTSSPMAPAVIDVAGKGAYDLGEIVRRSATPS